MRAVVLVGGAGTRLRPLTDTVPKQLLPVAEVLMLERVVGWLADHGVDDVVLSMGYHPEAFTVAFPDGRCGRAALGYAVEPEPLDTAGGIRFAARAAGIDETFVAVNGDVLTELDLGALVARHRRSGARATIHLTPVEDPSAFGAVEVDARGRVREFVEKPAPGTAHSNLINAGTYVLEPSVLEDLGEGRVSIERAVFPALAAEGSLGGVPTSDYWIDTGTPEKYIQANLDLVNGRRPPPPAPDASTRGDEAVWTLGAAVIDGEVRPPALVGDAALISATAKVESSVVGSGARVHEGAQVRGAVLLPGSVVRKDCVVEDSVVGPTAVVSEGAEVLAGTVIGAGRRVAPGSRHVAARVG